MSEIAEILARGTVEVEGRLVDASNATLFVKIALGDDSISAIYKPIAGERPLWDFQDGNLASRERAAYLVSEALGFNLIPLTILRDGPFGLGMMQEWIEIDTAIDLELFFRERNPQLRKVAILDAIINNTDRKIGHLLPSLNGDLFICDHGVTFHEEDKLRTVLWQWAGEELSEEEIELLEKLRRQLLEREVIGLAELITETEYAALIHRVERLASEKTFPVPSADWPAIPWPPF